MQAVIDNVHQQFIRAVAEGRKLDREKVAQVADGRILTGEQAKNFGLVDKMGNLQDTISKSETLHDQLWLQAVAVGKKVPQQFPTAFHPISERSHRRPL
jgi:ClpP class serine protease